MEAVVLVILLLGTLVFALKLSLRAPRWWWVWAAVLALATGLAAPVASHQSKTQIADFLQSPALMADAAVLLTLEVALVVAYCWLAVSPEPAKRTGRWARRLLEFFPGSVVFLALFSLLVWLMFTLTGTAFSLIAWLLAAAVLAVIPALAGLLRWLLPDPSLRLELLFMTALLMGMLGVVATVNGRTAVASSAAVEWLPLLAVVLLVLLGLAAGLLIRKFRNS